MQAHSTKYKCKVSKKKDFSDRAIGFSSRFPSPFLVTALLKRMLRLALSVCLSYKIDLVASKIFCFYTKINMRIGRVKRTDASCENAKAWKNFSQRRPFFLDAPLGVARQTHRKRDNGDSTTIIPFCYDKDNTFTFQMQVQLLQSLKDG